MILEPIPDSTPLPEPEPPTGAEVKALRQWAAQTLGRKITLEQAAQLMGVSVDTWKGWEYERRAMSPQLVLDFRRTVELAAQDLPPPPAPDYPPGLESKFGAVSPTKIKFYRECAALTRAEAGAVIGVTERAWKAWETGARPLKPEKLERWKVLASQLPVPEERAPQTPFVPAPKPKFGGMPDLPRVSEHPYDPELERLMQEALETPYMYDVNAIGAFLQEQAKEQDALKLASLAAGEARRAAETKSMQD